MFDNRVVCYQHKSGYRFSVDAVLLAHFLSSVKSGDTVLDLGTGCGIIPLILAYRYPDITCTGVEIQPALAELARQNFSVNRFAAPRLTVIEDDYCHASRIRQDAYDIVVSNPPFYKIGNGRMSFSTEKAVARHEIRATLEDTVRVASQAVKDGGYVALIYPPERQEELLDCLKKNSLAPGRMQMVYPYPGGEGVMLLVEAKFNGRKETRILSPFFIYREKGGPFTDQMLSFYEA
jgi:tRNA1(Val) A37 N6-methylase TrmN6